MANKTNYALFILGTLVSVFVWEFATLHKPDALKPSDVLEHVYTFSEKMFTKVGKAFAWISSFYTLLDLQDLGTAFCNLILPTIRIILSPLATVHGYLTYAKVYDNPWLVCAGSFTLAGIFLYFVHYMWGSKVSRLLAAVLIVIGSLTGLYFVEPILCLLGCMVTVFALIVAGMLTLVIPYITPSSN